MGALDGRDQLAQVGLHLIEVTAGPVDQLVAGVFAGRRRSQCGDHELRPEARMQRVPAVHVQHLAGATELVRALDLVLQDGGNAARAVAQYQLEILGPVAPAANLDIAYEQRLRDVASIRKFPDFHRKTKIDRGADGSCRTEVECRERPPRPAIMDSTAIVTGGTGGLGSAVVERLLRDGWRVVVPWIVERELERMPPRDGLELVQADLFDQQAVEQRRRAAAAEQREAPLRGLVNLVGGFAAGSKVHETPIEEFEKQFRLNLRPTYLVTQAALPQMLEAGGGAIVCVGTRAALQPFPGAAGYISSKAAVIAFAHAVATEYKNDSVRCNVILPSVIDTPANRASMPKADHDKWVKPAEIAGVIAHLLSNDSSPINGAAIPVYGRA